MTVTTSGASTSGPLILVAIGVEVVLLLTFLAVPRLADLLGGAWPSTTGWLFCLLAVTALPAVDATHTQLLHLRRTR